MTAQYRTILFILAVIVAGGGFINIVTQAVKPVAYTVTTDFTTSLPQETNNTEDFADEDDLAMPVAVTSVAVEQIIVSEPFYIHHLITPPLELLLPPPERITV